MSRNDARDRRTRRRTPEWLSLLLFTLAGAMLATLAVGAWDASAGDGNRTTEAVPRTVSWDGRLELDGQPVAGPVPLRFELVDAGGAVEWTEEHSSATSLGDVPVTAGRYSVALGTLTPLEAVIADGEPVSLRVSVGDGSGGWTTLLGDTPLDVSPWAQWSTRATELLVGGRLSVDDDEGATSLAGLMTDGRSDDPALARFGNLTIDAGQSLGHADLVAGAIKVAGNNNSQVHLGDTGAGRLRFHDSNPRLALARSQTNTAGDDVLWSDVLTVENSNEVGFRRSDASAPLHIAGITYADSATFGSGDAGSLSVSQDLAVTTLRAGGVAPALVDDTLNVVHLVIGIGTAATDPNFIGARRCWIRDFNASGNNTAVSRGVAAFVYVDDNDGNQDVAVINREADATSADLDASLLCLSNQLVDDQRTPL